mgnify:CR=1 FL=1|jgi:ABC-type Na+ transport system ATPase subunit NatA
MSAPGTGCVKTQFLQFLSTILSLSQGCIDCIRCDLYAQAERGFCG